MAKPKTSRWDYAHLVAKSAISMIPIAWWPLAELFNAIISPPLEKRRNKRIEWIEKWLIDLSERLNLTIENLTTNESFITSLVYATHIAIKNHQHEKLNALKNIVLNNVGVNSVDDDTKLIFLNYIDIFTTQHIVLLKFFYNPQTYITSPLNYSACSISTILEWCVPVFRWKRDFYDLIVNDLYSKWLINTNNIHTTMTYGWAISSRTTLFWNDFIKFISDPINTTT